MLNFRIICICVLTAVLCSTSDLNASQKRSSSSLSRTRSKMRQQYEMDKKKRERERAAEKARLEKGPSTSELKRAGHPSIVARKFLAVARAARSPSQLKNYVAKNHWETYEASKERFDPVLARKKLREVGNIKGTNADLVRRIHTDPSKAFVERFKKIGKQVIEVEGAHFHPTQKFKAVVSAKCVPDKVRDSFGRKAPTATIILVLEDGRWKFESYKFSIGISRSGGKR